MRREFAPISSKAWRQDRIAGGERNWGGVRRSGRSGLGGMSPFAAGARWQCDNGESRHSTVTDRGSVLRCERPLRAQSGHPNCGPPPSSAAVICVTAILTATGRKRQERSVHRAEERRRWTGMVRVCGPTCPHSSVLTYASAAQGAKRLISRRNQATPPSNGNPLGERQL